MTESTPQREAFGGGHESAHWSRHLWDHFRSTRTHVDRMYRAFGILAKGSRAAAEPPYVEHSNPEPDPVAEARAAAQYERDMHQAEMDDLDTDERSHTERERRIAELGGALEQGGLDEMARDAEAARAGQLAAAAEPGHEHEAGG